MFTGIIQHVGSVRSVARSADSSRLVIDLGPLANGLVTGQSVAVDGVCLTVAGLDRQTATFDAVAQTLAGTNLGQLRASSRVNLELPLALGGRLDGHLVAGHVDGLATLEQVGRAPDWLWRFGCQADLAAQMAPKGSVAVNGVSLTLVAVEQTGFSVALIPTTLARTNLGQLSAGAKVNVETDILGKYVRRYLQAMSRPGGLTLDKLRRAGFVS